MGVVGATAPHRSIALRQAWCGLDDVICLALPARCRAPHGLLVVPRHAKIEALSGLQQPMHDAGCMGRCAHLRLRAACAWRLIVLRPPWAPV
jgi:hypothetical protein